MPSMVAFKESVSLKTGKLYTVLESYFQMHYFIRSLVQMKQRKT